MYIQCFIVYSDFLKLFSSLNDSALIFFNLKNQLDHWKGFNTISQRWNNKQMIPLANEYGDFHLLNKLFLKQKNPLYLSFINSLNFLLTKILNSKENNQFQVQRNDSKVIKHFRQRIVFWGLIFQGFLGWFWFHNTESFWQIWPSQGSYRLY